MITSKLRSNGLSFSSSLTDQNHPRLVKTTRTHLQRNPQSVVLSFKLKSIKMGDYPGDGYKMSSYGLKTYNPQETVGQWTESCKVYNSTVVFIYKQFICLSSLYVISLWSKQSRRYSNLQCFSVFCNSRDFQLDVLNFKSIIIHQRCFSPQNSHDCPWVTNADHILLNSSLFCPCFLISSAKIPSERTILSPMEGILLPTHGKWKDPSL